MGVGPRKQLAVTVTYSFEFRVCYLIMVVYRSSR